ncbi:MAG: DNA polymerase I [Gammaproteobacteria bacterium]
MASKKTLVLVDGSSYLYRAFHALPPLMNSQNQPTGAIYGVINMIRRLIKDYDPEYVGVVFDAKGKTFRDQIYPAYKANRPPMPEDLKSQIAPLHQVIKAMGLPLICVSGVEADDVIGTYAREAAKENFDVVISTGDKDLAQLVNSRITLVNTMTNKTMDAKGVEEKFGLPPERIIDYLTLVGDTSDNIPGVEKVGPKTAVKWLTQYGSLAEIIKHADEIKGKVGENLRNAIERLPVSKTLVTIKDNVELEDHFETLTIKPHDEALLKKLFKELEFKTWFRELESGEVKRKVEKKYQTILDEKEFHAWCEKVKKSEYFAFDAETTNLNYMDARVVGVSLSVTPFEACYIPFAHDYEGAPKQLSRETVLSTLKPILENDTLKKVGHNLKYDYEVLANHNIHMKGIYADTMLESYVMNSVASRHNMDTLALKYLDHKTISYEEVAGKGAKQLTFDKVELEKACEYAAEDADITLQLHHVFSEKLKDDKKLLYVLNNIELPLVTVLANMERTGVLVDAQKLKRQSESLEKRIREIEGETFLIAGEEFNLSSPSQLQAILYDKLQLPVLKKTPKGQPSTAEPVLTELALDYPLPKLIIEHRQLSKLKSTYADQLPLQMNASTGRIHCSYHQAVTATGRLSSSDPNLQNIPVRTEQGRQIRQAFIPEKGCKILAADYSQIELRIMAHLSEDKGLLDAFQHGRDIHQATAAEIFGVAVDDVNPQQRRHAKVINFGLIYGMSAFGLARQLGVDRGAAQQYIDRYFERYPGVKRYMEETRLKAREEGFVETLCGRRLYLPMIRAQNKMQQQAAERTAINAPMQGTAADIIKLAMIEIDGWIRTKNPPVKMIMQVHDELVFEVQEDFIDNAKQEIQQRMESSLELLIPLLVSIGVGDNWDEAH